jgi:DNA-binding response OmpR family regulator
MRILLIEDDPSVAEMVRSGLAAQHYSVDVATTAASGEELALVNRYDTIILDWMLPDRDGPQLLRTLRSSGCNAPVLMLTGKSGEEDMIAGLDAGADDYLGKPFSLGVLLARVRSLVRRQAELKDSRLTVAGLEIDLVGRSVRFEDQEIELSAKEFALLECLVLNPNRILSRERIAEHVWDMNFDPQSNVITSLVRHVRSKIEPVTGRPIIQTVRGLGYRLAV